MKEKTKVKLLALAIMLVTMTLMPIGQVKAALQANPNTQYIKKATPENWMKGFRQMETTGGAMGLNETLKGDLTSESSNGIDVHMMRTTEYGAIAILSASGYGNPSNDQAITSTTGNETGIILNTTKDWEWTAGGLQGSIFSGVNNRYFDTYTSSPASARAGDALGSSTTTNSGAAGWHSASRSYWVGSSYPYFLRGSGGIFSFDRGSSDGYYGRGVVVCGAGL